MLFWGAIFIFWGMGYGGSVKMCTFSALFSVMAIRKVSFLWKSLRTKHRDGIFLCFFDQLFVRLFNSCLG